uniref:Pancreatic trypsin inhibitor n=1 Tax=Rhipicephalus appendiculatus TaxID=34631 RepID=A0A131YNH7_RHIAP
MNVSLFVLLTGLSCLFFVEGKIQWKPITKKPTGKDGLCNLPPDTGLCKASIPKFYFNSTVKKCLVFTYGGCGGNENNFASEHECKQRCGKWKPAPTKPPGKNDTCNLPPEKGLCRASISMFYFNSTANKCMVFKYGGCGGNENKFHSKEGCERKCGRKELWKPAPSQPTRKPIACSLPPVTGNCKASIPSFYFDPGTNKCRGFTYGGCGGNANNFDSMKQCEYQCGSKYSKETDSCRTSKRKGMPCSGKLNLATALWYFDTSYEKCKKYKYWKCGGNMTMFSSCSECVNTCRTHMKTLQVCTKEKLPK